MSQSPASPPEPLQFDDEPVAVTRLTRPLQRFIDLEVSGGLLLALATVAALVWANSPWREAYDQVWHLTGRVSLGDGGLALSLLHWIDDGLMALFFFVVGLEIKRELLVGELATLRQAALPVAAAIGGMVVPAALYMAFNAGGAGGRGWAVPMATDIAFTLGVMVLLGRRAPRRLRVFVTALAIVDDLGAVLIIALFYAGDILPSYLLAAALILALLLLLNAAGMRHPLPYALLGLALWLAVLQSGLHATIAGVLAALAIPVRARIDGREFLRRAQASLQVFRADLRGEAGHSLPTADQRVAIAALEASCEQAESPLHRLEDALHPWVTFLVLPVFALANAGVAVGGDPGMALGEPIGRGILFGLVLGKPLGIVVACALVVRLGLAELPRGISWRHLTGAACLCGIGFTMALFIANLAYSRPEQIATAKLAILGASLMAGILGALVLAWSPPILMEDDDAD
ncbi:MAG: Na+/H+ antiporter NhaA [Ardenticatenia bacterium]|nr:Na+/H+ antiporter NhaA [Ardenticatenia bacterium]